MSSAVLPRYEYLQPPVLPNNVTWWTRSDVIQNDLKTFSYHSNRSAGCATDFWICVHDCAWTDFGCQTLLGTGAVMAMAMEPYVPLSLIGCSAMYFACFKSVTDFSVLLRTYGVKSRNKEVFSHHCSTEGHCYIMIKRNSRTLSYLYCGLQRRKVA